jgi:pimeloyl-ACP methyl ester carboxylesterase
MNSFALLRHLLRKILMLVLIITAIPIIFLAGCQSKLLYYPRPYSPGTTAEWQQRTSGKKLEFTTSQGKQRAFLQGNLKSPRNLWIFCAGNGTLALEWSEWIQQHAPMDDAWLMIDYPGYGDCKGSPNPARIRENLKNAVPLAVHEIGWTAPVDPKRLRFFGHSLGSAACLIAASEFEIQRGVLISPFTSTMEMSQALTGLPLGFLVWHRFDNSARLAELAARGPGQVIILHGSDDEVIPVWMSRNLAAQHPNVVRFTEIPGGQHNTIQEEHTDEVAAALREIGK